MPNASLPISELFEPPTLSCQLFLGDTLELSIWNEVSQLDVSLISKTALGDAVPIPTYPPPLAIKTSPDLESEFRLLSLGLG